MRYTSWADVVARYPNIAKAGQAEATAIDAGFILGVEGVIDAKLATRYAVPFSNTPSLAPPVIKDLATDMSYYKIAMFKLSAEQAKILQDDINSRLKDLITGDMLVLTGSGTIIDGGAPATVWGTHQSYPNITNVDSFSNFQFSNDETIDASNSRDPSVYGNL